MVDQDLRTPSDRLIYLMKKSGYNQPELADLLPVSVSTINRWFSGKTKHIDGKKRELIANKMGFDSHWIETGEQNHAQEAIDAVNRVEETVAAYKGKEPTLDDLPELIRLRDMLDEKIDKLVKRKNRG